MQSKVEGRGRGARILTCAALGGFFEAAAILVEVLDQSVHQILRIAMRQVFDERGHVDNRVAGEHAQPEIVEIKKPHFLSPTDCCVVLFDRGGRSAPDN
jgi:hypothetical protein